MKILLDTNVIMTYLTGREDKYINESQIIMNKCIQKQLDGFVAFHSLSILWFLWRGYSLEQRFQWLKFICDSLTIAYADNDMLKKAIGDRKFTDFEDNLQDCCAQTVNADYIITANVKDFKDRSKVPAIPPDDFISLILENNMKNTSASFEVHENASSLPYGTPRFKIYLQEDLDKHTWIAFSSDIPGVFMDDKNYDSLIARVLDIAPCYLKHTKKLKDYHLDFFKIAPYKQLHI